MVEQYFSRLMYRKRDSEGNVTGEYPDQISLKLKQQNGKFTVKCFGPDKNPADPEKVLTRGCYVKAIIEINPVYLKKTSFSLSATALQLRVYPGAPNFTGYQFLPDEDDDEVIVLGNLDEASQNITNAEAQSEEEDDGEEIHEVEEVNEVEVEVGDTEGVEEETPQPVENDNSDESASPVVVKKGRSKGTKKK
jgi:hypothetical protein